VFQPSSIPLWTAITGLAGVGQVAVLIVTARFVWRYLDETQKLRKLAQEQLKASWRQVEIANDQLEAQIRPAVAADVSFTGGIHVLKVTNVGKGVATNLRFSSTRKGSAGDGRLPSLVPGRIGFLEPSAERGTSIRTHCPPGEVARPDQNLESVQCEYKSLSGRTYYTVVDFNAEGVSVEDTRFYWDPETD
jgi:hypothetical protein